MVSKCTDTSVCLGLWDCETDLRRSKAESLDVAVDMSCKEHFSLSPLNYQAKIS